MCPEAFDSSRIMCDSSRQKCVGSGQTNLHKTNFVTARIPGTVKLGKMAKHPDGPDREVESEVGP